MISQNTIDAVFAAADLLAIVGKDVKLKRSGSNYVGGCPFHNEKTPSFVVSPSKGIYKCFGCGESGGAVTYLMNLKKMSFPEAIKQLAADNGITVEEDNTEAPEKTELRDDILKVTQWAAKKYHLNRVEAPEIVKQYLHDRFSEDDLIQWQIGYAPDDWRWLTPTIIERGKYDAAKQAGITSTSKGKNYDTIRNRITFPIFNRQGLVVGLGARKSPTLKDGPKYINSPESVAYNKSAELYGLNYADKKIREEKCVYLCEGYTDVIAMHRYGHENTVATCGTSLTDVQAKILKRYASHIIIMRDGDDAGHKAALRDLHILLPHGLKASIILLPDGQDPDSFLKENTDLPKPIDALKWVINQKYQAVDDDDIHQRWRIVDELAALLNNIQQSPIRNSYVNQISSTANLKARDIDARLKELNRANHADELTEEDEALKQLSPSQREQYLRHGFFEKVDKGKTGYYFGGGDRGFKAKTNFVLQPLYHIYGSDNRRMMQVTNGIEDAVVEVPSKNMLSPDQLLAILFNEGFFLPREGFGKDHLYRILNRIAKDFPLVYELHVLGWQAEGFFAFQNITYQPGTGLVEYNEHGVVQVGSRSFLSPSKSKSQDKNREGENVYENDLYLKHVQPSINFEGWADLMCKVYGSAGWIGVAWSVATLFRDLIIKVAPMPHLYAYGQVGSGKSMFGESVQALFFSGKDRDGNLYKPMNLNQGTDFAFFNRYERFSNCPNLLNEFDENAIKEEWFRAIKSSFDGEGREKGKGQKNRTTSQAIRCSTLLMGQYLGSKDDNSVLTRSLPIAFHPKDNRTQEEINNFRALKGHEASGLSGILCQLLDLRDEMRAEYATRFHESMKKIQAILDQKGVHPMDRIIKNITCMATCMGMVLRRWQMPFNYDDFVFHLIEYAIEMHSITNSTSGLSEFWNAVEYLVDQGLLEPGFDYAIREYTPSIKTEDKGERVFTEPKKVVFFRVNGVHMRYSEQVRKAKGEKPINRETLKLYIKDQPYYLGSIKSHRFSSERQDISKNTSCIALDFDLLPVNLDRSLQQNEPISNKNQRFVGEFLRTPTKTTLGDAWQFTIKVVETTNLPGGGISSDEKIIKCYTSDGTIDSIPVDNPITVDGLLKVKETRSGTFYTMDVHGFFSGIDPQKHDDDVPF